MRIEIGINPNCSELVVRLDTADENYIKEELAKIGIKEVLVRGFYRFEEEPKEWDGNSNELDKKVVPTSELDPEIMEIWKQLRSNEEFAEGEYDALCKKLKDKYNIDYMSDVLVLEDKENNLPDFEHRSSINLGRDRNYEDEFENIAFWAHQHCQWQLFPTLKKISEHFNAEVEPFDGGSIQAYEAFLEGMTPEEWGEDLDA
jgi:hypothetical protein